MYEALGETPPGLPSGRGAGGNPIVLPGLEVKAGGISPMVWVALLLLLLWMMEGE